MTQEKTRDTGAAGRSGRKLVIVTERCPSNHSCPAVRACPVGALSQEGYSAPVVDCDKCISCGKCVKRCPKRVLTLE